MSEKQSIHPFKPLGQKLKSIRQKLNESLAEVSGAVEIDQIMLERIELGVERPNEEILLLLISHFDIKDEEAAVLWQLAGYDQPRSHDHDMRDDALDRNMVLVMAVDPRVIYSDNLQVNANSSGVVMNFSQAGDGNSRSLIAARIGMSREQARTVLHVLHEALQRSEPRQLPSSTEIKPRQSKSKSKDN
jgi:transcriptional regulator with XRE-family HTH domain